jgi:integrase
MVQRAEGVWRLRVFVGRNPVTGNPVQVHRTFKGTEPQAKKALARLVTEADDGKFSKETITLGDLLDRWMDNVEHTPATAAGYRGKIEHRIRPALGHMRISKLDSSDLDAWYRKWQKEDELAVATVRQLHAIIRAALAQAVKWKLVDHNEALAATPPKLKKTEMTTPTPIQLMSMIAYAQDHDPMLAAAIAIAAGTGARRGELCALRFSDFDLRRRTLRISRSLSLVDGELHIGETKTHQARTISLSNQTVRVMIVRWRAMVDLSEQADSPLVDDPYVLSRRADGAEPCKPDGLSHAFRALNRKLGMDFHLHQCRHYSASLALAGGADLRTVAGRLGHADASVTATVYAHVQEAQDREAARIVGRSLTPKGAK